MPKIIEFLEYDPMPADSGSLGEKLLRYRRSHGISQKEMAELIGIDPTTLSRFKRNKGRCFRKVLQNVDDFLKGHGERKTKANG